MVLLDKLLPKLKERDSRVLIFSQVIFFFCKHLIVTSTYIFHEQSCFIMVDLLFILFFYFG